MLKRPTLRKAQSRSSRDFPPCRNHWDRQRNQKLPKAINILLLELMEARYHKKVRKLKWHKACWIWWSMQSTKMRKSTPRWPQKESSTSATSIAESLRLKTSHDAVLAEAEALVK
jgi:hypothetical protein